MTLTPTPTEIEKRTERTLWRLSVTVENNRKAEAARLRKIEDEKLAKRKPWYVDL